jgi:hypothetical protein
MRTVAVGVLAAGQTSWAADRELTLVGACVTRKGTLALTSGPLLIVSKDKNADIASWPQTTASPQLDNYLVVVGPFTYGKNEVKIPVRLGETLFVSFADSGYALLYFDDVVS